LSGGFLLIALPVRAVALSHETGGDLSNPAGALIGARFQFSFVGGYGATGDRPRPKMTIQPVVPFLLNDGWNAISCSISKSKRPMKTYE